MDEPCSTCRRGRLWLRDRLPRLKFLTRYGCEEGNCKALQVYRSRLQRFDDLSELEGPHLEGFGGEMEDQHLVG